MRRIVLVLNQFYLENKPTYLGFELGHQLGHQLGGVLLMLQRKGT
jgi:hypothetical protein